MHAIFLVHCWVNMRPYSTNQLTTIFQSINQPQTLVGGEGAPKNTFALSPHVCRSVPVCDKKWIKAILFDHLDQFSCLSGFLHIHSRKECPSRKFQIFYWNSCIGEKKNSLPEIQKFFAPEQKNSLLYHCDNWQSQLVTTHLDILGHDLSCHSGRNYFTFYQRKNLIH